MVKCLLGSEWKFIEKIIRIVASMLKISIVDITKRRKTKWGQSSQSNLPQTSIVQV